MSLWIVIAILLPLVFVTGGILVFNIYFRKQIAKDIVPKPIIDSAYIEAEKTMADDEDLGSVLDRRKTQQ